MEKDRTKVKIFNLRISLLKFILRGTAPDPRHGHSSVTANTNIIYYGGRGNGHKLFYDKLFIFDTLNELWYKFLRKFTTH